MHSVSDLGPADRHRQVAQSFGEVSRTVADWDAQTPVPEWVARDVVTHLATWLPGFLAAHQVEFEVATHADDPAATFGALAKAVQRLLDADDSDRIIVSDMFGEIPLNVLVDRFYTADVFMHTWDLAQSNGITPTLDPDFAQSLHQGLVGMGPMLQQSGQFGPPVPVPEGTDEVASLMAFIGRDPQFTAR